MKKLLTMLLLTGCVTAALAQDVMKKEADGTYVVNTTTLATDVQGYQGTTPLLVYIQKNKVVKVELLKNQESPRHNARVKSQMLSQYAGQKVTRKKQPQVDGVTGSTYTSKAMQENVRRALQYYWQHK